MRYYFHVENGARERDTSGIELDGETSTLVAEATSLMARTLKDTPERLNAASDVVIRVEDATGLILLTVHTVLLLSPAIRLSESGD